MQRSFDTMCAEEWYRRMAQHLAGFDRLSRAFVVHGATPNWERCRDMVNIMVAYGKKHSRVPSGGGTSADNNQLDWNDDTYVDNATADAVREFYRIWHLWDRYQSNSKKAKEDAARREEEAKEFRDQARAGRCSPLPKVTQAMTRELTCVCRALGSSLLRRQIMQCHPRDLILGCSTN